MRGQFVFSDHQIFKPILDYIEGGLFPAIYLNMAEVEFVDSAALGLLLLAKEKSEGSSSRLILEHPTGQVAKMFEISCFHEIFEVIHLDQAS